MQPTKTHILLIEIESDTMANEVVEMVVSENLFGVQDMIVWDDHQNNQFLSFTITGDPQSQQRHRIALMTCSQQRRSKPVIYDPSSILKKRYAAAVTSAMVEHGLVLPHFLSAGHQDQGLIMEAHYFLERPPSHYTGAGLLKVSAPRYPMKKDIDNLEKFVLDALQSVMYNNDNMVRKSQNEKSYSAGAAYTKLVFRTYI